MADAPRDQNHVTTALFEIDGSSGSVMPGQIDQATGRILVDSGGGGGTVETISIASANGFAGTSDGDPTDPVLTISTTVTGIVKGNGTALSAASAGTDYVAPGAITTSGLTMATDRLLGRTTAATGAVEELTVGSGLTLAAGSLSATGVAGSIVVGTTTITGGTTTRILYDNAGVLGEYTLTGSGTVVAMQTNPTLSGITMADGTNIVLDSTTGTKIGTATTQKLAFYNSTPIVQPTGDIVTAMQNLGLGASLTVSGATTITVANEATDTTCFPIFVTAATGDLGPKSNAGLTFNSNTALLTATLLAGTTSVTSAAILASSNDSGAIGAAATAFSDLFLASGALIGFGNGNAVITHSSGVIEVTTGDLRVTTAGTNSASAVTVGGTQTLTNKTLTSPAINTATLGGAQQLAEGASIRLDSTLSADGTYSGTTISGTAGATLAFGDIIYLAVADSRWELADASAVSTAGSVLVGFCVLAAAADGDPTVILLNGNIRADTAFPALTVGAAAFISETAGDITNTAPTTTDSVTRVVGHALDANTLLVNISPDWVTHT